MEWEDYRVQFIRQAKDKNKTDEYIQSNLEYAEVLFGHNVPVIYDLEHLSRLVGYDKQYIRSVCFAPTKFYRNFTIPKKSGGFRDRSSKIGREKSKTVQ